MKGENKEPYIRIESLNALRWADHRPHQARVLTQWGFSLRSSYRLFPLPPDTPRPAPPLFPVQVRPTGPPLQTGPLFSIDAHQRVQQ